VRCSVFAAAQRFLQQTMRDRGSIDAKSLGNNWVSEKSVHWHIPCLPSFVFDSHVRILGPFWPISPSDWVAKNLPKFVLTAYPN